MPSFWLRKFLFYPSCFHCVFFRDQSILQSIWCFLYSNALSTHGCWDCNVRVTLGICCPCNYCNRHTIYVFLYLPTGQLTHSHVYDLIRIENMLKPHDVGVAIGYMEPSTQSKSIRILPNFPYPMALSSLSTTPFHPALSCHETSCCTQTSRQFCAVSQCEYSYWIQK